MTEPINVPPVLPELPGGRVIMAFMDIGPDGPDPNVAPDWVPAVGVGVTFTPLGIPAGTLMSYDNPIGPKVVTRINPVRGAVNIHGWVVNNSTGSTEVPELPIFLLATDDDLISPSGWMWRATFSTGGYVDFGISAGTTINLADFILAPPGSPVVQSWAEKIPELITTIDEMRAIQAATEQARDQATPNVSHVTVPTTGWVNGEITIPVPGLKPPCMLTPTTSVDSALWIEAKLYAEAGIDELVVTGLVPTQPVDVTLIWWEALL